MNKLFAASVRSEYENGDERVWVIAEVASNKEEAHGKIHERLKRDYPKLIWSAPNILEISQEAIEACSRPNPIPKELKKPQQPSGLIAGKLRELIDSKSWGLTFNSSLKEFALETAKYLAEITKSADDTWKYAGKLEAELASVRASLEEVSEDRKIIMLEKLTLENEVERLQKQVEFLQKSNEIVNETNSSLRENLKNVESAYTSVFNDNKTIKDSINTVLEANEKLAARLMDFSDQFREMSDEL